MVPAKLKSELHCPVCQHLFQYPLLLPCGHSVCAACANKLWFPSKWCPKPFTNDSRASGFCGSGEDAVSEADSGVVVCCTESNGSLNAPSSVNTTVHPPPVREHCPLCTAIPKLPSDDLADKCSIIQSAENWWPKNIALENLIRRLSGIDVNDGSAVSIYHVRRRDGTADVNPSCQLCEVRSFQQPTLSFCEQCQLWYCDSCLLKWHPTSGLLGRHQIKREYQFQTDLPKVANPIQSEGVRCADHNYPCKLFCMDCSSLVCVQCLNDSSVIDSRRHTYANRDPSDPVASIGISELRDGPVDACNQPVNGVYGHRSHTGHVICATTTQARRLKAELTERLQLLSGHAKRGGELVQELKASEARMKKSIPSMEASVNQEIDNLIAHLERHRNVLLDQLRSQMQQRSQQLRDLVNRVGNKLSATTSLLHLAVEFLKEPDAAAFIQVVPSIHMRLSSNDIQYNRDLGVVNNAKSGGEIELRVNTTKFVQLIDSIQLEEHHAPPIPFICSSQCVVDGNALHIVWSSTSSGSSNDIFCSHVTSQCPYLPYQLDMVQSPCRKVDNLVSALLHPTPVTVSSRYCSTAAIQTNKQYPFGTSPHIAGRTIGQFPASVSAYNIPSERATPEPFLNGVHFGGSSKKLTTSVTVSDMDFSDRTSSHSLSTLHQHAGMDNEHSQYPANDLNRVIYFLEVDNGRNGPYKVAYTGTELACRLEGLQFNTLYRLRVRAANKVGHSAYSEVVTLRTSRLAKFRMVPSNRPNGLCSRLHVDPDGMRVTATGDVEDRVLLANVGFSQGVHYWEWQIEAFDGRGQPSFGVALSSVDRERMLGLDDAGWAMYLNADRSWFLHAAQHRDRTDGGIGTVVSTTDNEKIRLNTGFPRRVSKPAVIGVRLDCDQGHLGFYLNGEPHGPMAFTNLLGSAKQQQTVRSSLETVGLTAVDDGGSELAQQTSARPTLFYPAVSLNYHTSVRLITGLEVPSESEESSESSEAEYDVSIASLPHTTGSLSSTSSTPSNPVDPSGHCVPALPDTITNLTSVTRSTTVPTMAKLDTIQTFSQLQLPPSSLAGPKSPTYCGLVTFGRS
ncbi:hypothetical protein EG68_04210 [Paragonimus skrjabini miyazakii]|uniref:E3 ubiquitin-protein ligase TRIM9 n=1 Tax=Paragonimus skrjabini miyazakii TaxID=59628 RepID=A0A8S9YZJ9_9TREM|nr:hypothetical protein EG68_04210 [Paragonimus skrjabini miyazakii]